MGRERSGWDEGKKCVELREKHGAGWVVVYREGERETESKMDIGGRVWWSMLMVVAVGWEGGWGISSILPSHLLLSPPFVLLLPTIPHHLPHCDYYPLRYQCYSLLYLFFRKQCLSRNVYIRNSFFFFFLLYFISREHGWWRTELVLNYILTESMWGICLL